MNAILKYPGGKWRISDWIISHFPAHKVYCEPFFGSGGVFFNKEPSYIETINDINGHIVNLFKVCREYPEELAAAINFTPFSRDEFIACMDLDFPFGLDKEDCIERARKTLVRYHQSFGTSNSTKKSWRNVQTAGGPRCATMWNYLPETIINCCQRLKEAQIEHIDALTLIARYNDENTLLYLDPPYLQGLRKRNMYECEFSDEQHRQLLQLIKKSKSKIILSGYDNELYNTALSDWETDQINTTAQMGKKRVEKLWMNYQRSLLW